MVLYIYNITNSYIIVILQTFGEIGKKKRGAFSSFEKKGPSLHEGYRFCFSFSDFLSFAKKEIEKKPNQKICPHSLEKKRLA